jgi:hypothetical protein
LELYPCSHKIPSYGIKVQTAPGVGVAHRSALERNAIP